MSFQQSINSALFSAAHVRFFGKAAKALEEDTKAVKEEAEAVKLEMKNKTETTEIKGGKENVTIPLTSKVVTPKTPQQKAAYDMAAEQEAKYRLGMEERPAKQPAPSYVSGGKSGNKIVNLTPQEKATESLNKNLAEKAEQKAAVKERTELLKDPKAAVAKADEAPAAVRRTEVSASEAKKLIQESEQKEKQKKELEEKAKKALEEGGNK